MKNKVRPIAFYLPQFYPTPENDEWWSPGFTEWTNVAKATPLFKNHYQPRIPADLGFYDLRVPEVREKQAQLAREAGVEGFCYWHYWFAGRRLLDRVFSEVVESGKPDFPFCLCWANHSWYAKTWTYSKTDYRLLIEQTYPGKQDYINHFNAMLPAFKDPRYMKHDGRLIFGIFDADMFPGFDEFKETWNELAKENGLKGFYFFGLAQGINRYNNIKNKNFDTIVLEGMPDFFNEYTKNKFKNWYHNWLMNGKFKIPYSYSYDKYVQNAIALFKMHPEATPCIVPDFDHSPRSSRWGIILKDSTPEKWGNLVKAVSALIRTKQQSNNLLFIKSWNEWGEGNYLEPDLKWGEAYIQETKLSLL